MTELESYQHLFAWIGIVHTLQISSGDECDTDIDLIRNVFFDAYRAAKSYTGSNEQLKSGFQHMLDTMNDFVAFYPELTSMVAACSDDTKI